MRKNNFETSIILTYVIDVLRRLLGWRMKKLLNVRFFGIIISWDGVNLRRKFLGSGSIRTP